MNNIDREMEEKIKEFNKLAKDRYDKVLNIKNQNFKDFINENFGEIYIAKKPLKEELLDYEKKGGIVGVDGSVNRKGGASPHYIEFFRSLAKSTIKNNEEIFLTEIYSPILEEDEIDLYSQNDEYMDKRNKILSKLEVEVAIKAAKELKPYLIMMDGTFIRYIIDCKETWKELREICEREKILLIGVIEDIKTNIIGSKLKELGFTENISYDREVLFGKFNIGEFIIIEDSDKSRAGELSSALMRSSLSPNIIGIDIIDTQRLYLKEMVNLVYGLTPEASRGFPIWLDIVDKEVKISNKMMEGFLETYLDREVYERFFIETRSKRN